MYEPDTLMKVRLDKNSVGVYRDKSRGRARSEHSSRMARVGRSMVHTPGR